MTRPIRYAAASAESVFRFALLRVAILLRRSKMEMSFNAGAVVLSFENPASCIFQCAMVSMLDAQGPLGRSGGHFNHGRNMIFPLGQDRQARHVIYEPAGIDHIHREKITVRDLVIGISVGATGRRIGILVT